jgi:tetratricopeptide (TPR) repeat protein
VTPRRAGLALLLLATGAAGVSPFQVEQRDVREGNERLGAGDPAAALPRYDAAEKATGPRAEIDYDRGNALYRLGRHAEARDAWRRALDRGAGALGTRALQNLGNALAASGDREGAITAYSEALRADPSNDDARFDLEVLLRKKDAGERPPPPAGGSGQKPRDAKDAPQREQARDQGAAEPQRHAAQPEQAQTQQPQPQPQPQQRAGDRPEAQQRADARAEPPPSPETPEPRPGEGARPAPGEGPDTPQEAGGDGKGRRAPLAREDAEKLLDALRAREKNMPLGSGRERKAGRRADAAKDW